MDSTLRTLIVNGTVVDVAKQLLTNGWRKSGPYIFQRERNNYNLKIDGTNHPMWKIEIEPKTDEFDDNDWKLRQDMRSIANIGKPSADSKKLYINNEKTKADLMMLIKAMQDNTYNLIFNNEYIAVRTKANKLKIFKIAAAMDLTEQPDGWYAGQKKMF
jgi:hypothetical protein